MKKTFFELQVYKVIERLYKLTAYFDFYVYCICVRAMSTFHFFLISAFVTIVFIKSIKR